MKRSSTFLLAALTALGLAACNPPRNDTNTGAPGSESGSMSTPPADTMTTGGGAATGAASDTGAMSDTAHAASDSAKTK